MSSARKKWIMFLLRWGIAVGGVYWVVSNLSLRDRVLIARPDNGWPASVEVRGQASDTDEFFRILDPFVRPGQTVERLVGRTDLLVRAEPRRLRVRTAEGERKMDVTALLVRDGRDRNRWPLVMTPPRSLFERYLNVQREPAQVVEPAHVLEPYSVAVPYPLVDVGIIRMVRQAKASLLWGALLVMPLTFLLTSIRWHALLLALEIQITQARAFVLNMVGAFYNTFMLGSTGGDVLKAYYAARQAPTRRTRAVMSVIVDRILGLLALIMLGGVMAAYQYFRIDDPADPVARACLQVALGSALILAGIFVTLVLFFSPLARRWLGLDYLLSRLPMQTQVRKAIEVMAIYRQRPRLVLWAILITFPVHITVIFSAMLAGNAFGLPLSPLYYFVAVPVIVLSGAVPISPQGAGVMEFFAILLTRREGATVAQAVALTMSIRLVQIFWNLSGGLFVLRGGYHAPSAAEQRELESDIVSG